MGKWKRLGLLALLFSFNANAVTVPYTFSSGQQIKASEVNANFSTLQSAFNSHNSASNPHNSTLANILSAGNSCGSTNIDFNGTQALTFRVENVSSDPSCASGSKGRIIYNTVDDLLKFCDGSSYVSIAGSGVNTLQSVLSAGNSAGSYDIDLNGHELISARVENLSADPSAGSIGRLIYNTSTSAFKIDNGVSWDTIGGAQGLASVLGVSNSAGSTNIDFNGTQGLNFRLQNLSSDPGSSSAGRVYYNTSTGKPKFYNGSSWSEIGNTNSLSAVLAIGNSAGAYDLDMNMNEIQNFKVENLASPPGTGNAGRMWYDTIGSDIYYAESAVNRTLVSTDKTQTLTNKSISGSSNTFTNIPDSALSANVDLLDTAQTVSAKKTFSSAPQISRIKTASGTTSGHLIPNGLSDDEFVLANAVQTLAGKTLNGPALSGNMDFNNYQATEFRVENRSSDPSPGNAGRIFYKTSTGELIYDTGSSLRVLSASGSPPITEWKLTGNTGTVAGTNFLGTLDAQDVVVKANNSEVLRAKSGGGIDVIKTSNQIRLGTTNTATINASAPSASRIYTISDPGADASFVMSEGNSTVNGNKSFSGTTNFQAITVEDPGAGTNTVTISAPTLAGDYTLTLPTNDGSASQYLQTDGSGVLSWANALNSLNGLTDISQTFATGTAGTDFNISSSTSTHTFNIPDASATARGLVTTGTQTFAGAKTFSTTPIFSALSTGVVHSDSSGNLTSSTIVDADISATAAIAFSKLDALTSGNILVGNGSNVATSVAMSGDVTISNAGVTAIGANKVTDSMLRQSSGLSVIGRSANSTGNVADITAANDGEVLFRNGTSIGFGTISNSSINASAAIDRSKIASGTANHVVINDGSGNLSSEANLAVSRGGTGAGTFTANNVLLGNGTSAFQVVAPGTSGNVLTSNGTTWTSAAPSAGNAPQWISFGGSSERSQCTSNPCTIYDQSGTTGTFISSVGRNGTGDYTINFVSGVYSRAPVVVCYDAQGNGNTTFMSTTGAAPTTTAVRIAFYNYNVPGVRDTQADCIITGKP